MTPDASARDLDQQTHGEAYENFVSGLYVTAIRLGAPTRAGLRGDGVDDAAVTVGTRELVARGLLGTTDDPDVWEVVPPRDALARYADSLERRVELMRATASEVDALWRRSAGEGPLPSHTGLDLLAGVDTIAYRVSYRHRTATRRLWWAVDGSPVARRLLEEARTDPDRLQVRDGVERRVLLDTSMLDDEAALEHAELSRAAGHSVAVGTGVPFSVLLADAGAALVDLSSYDPEGTGSAELRLPAPVRAVARLLEEMWALSTPFAPGLRDVLQREDRLPVTERDQRILALLTTGASDQVIARQTGVSVRTVERRVRYLMDHLGAATRFQAGVQAARHDWI